MIKKCSVEFTTEFTTGKAHISELIGGKARRLTNEECSEFGFRDSLTGEPVPPRRVRHFFKVNGIDPFDIDEEMLSTLKCALIFACAYNESIYAEQRGWTKMRLRGLLSDRRPKRGGMWGG